MTDAWTLVPRRRVILDNDWAGDPDGLVALTHHLLSPTDEVTLVTSTHVSPLFPGSADGAARGAELARDLLRRLGRLIPVVPGGEAADPALADAAPAARAIVEEAMRDDPLPLVLVCAGPLSNVAAALRRDPGIASRLRLVWVGDSRAPAFEYNREADADAFGHVFVAGELAIDAIPLETYRTVRLGVTELRRRLVATGSVGTWLWRCFEELDIPPEIPLGETWALGDSLPLLVTALENDATAWEQVGANRRLLLPPDPRLLIDDFFAKLAAFDR